MLILTRRVNEVLLIGDIALKVEAVRRKKVKFSFTSASPVVHAKEIDFPTNPADYKPELTGEFELGADERYLFGCGVRLTLVRFLSPSARIGVEAPREMYIIRQELHGI